MIKMNWGVGFPNNQMAHPLTDIEVRLIEGHQDRYTHFDITFTDGQRRRHKRLRMDMPRNLPQSRKRAQDWLERNLDEVMDAQAATAPVPQTQADLMRLINRKIDLTAELDQVLRDHDRALAEYALQMDRAKRGDRTKQVPSGVFKTFPILEYYTVHNGSMGESWTERHSRQVGEEHIEQMKSVPDYPDKPEYPKRAYQIKREIEEIDDQLS